MARGGIENSNGRIRQCLAEQGSPGENRRARIEPLLRQRQRPMPGSRTGSLRRQVETVAGTGETKELERNARAVSVSQSIPLLRKLCGFESGRDDARGIF